MMTDEPVISIVAPIYNEIGNLPVFYRRVKAALEQIEET
jgi:hypothetical protein